MISAAFWMRVRRDQISADRRDGLKALDELAEELDDLVWQYTDSEETAREPITVGDLRRWAAVIGQALALIEVDGDAVP
jgi:hypothetical protein